MIPIKEYLFGIKASGKVYSENVEVSKITHQHDGVYIPYTGASEDVDLGGHSLATSGKITSATLGFNNTDPATVNIPGSGNVYYGSYQGKLWQLNSLGKISWYATQEDLIDLSFGTGVEAKFRAQALNDLATVYPNQGAEFIGKLKSLGIMNQVSLIITPGATKQGTLLSLFPFKKGNFTCTRASKATQINEFGQLETVDNDVPRIDYSGTRVS